MAAAKLRGNGHSAENAHLSGVTANIGADVFTGESFTPIPGAPFG